jgi:hypothetical protein
MNHSTYTGDLANHGALSDARPDCNLKFTGLTHNLGQL